MIHLCSDLFPQVGLQVMRANVAHGSVKDGVFVCYFKGKENEISF